MTPAPYLSIAAHYDACLARYGDTARGADWPNEEDRARRFDVMLDVGAASCEAATVCDLGCGTGEFYRHIRARGLSRIDYRGIDISPVAIDYARGKFPGVPFFAADVLELDEPELKHLLACDYLVINGLFTRKGELGTEQMWCFLKAVVERVWPCVRRGLAFNVMSKQVDWERDDLFHLSLDDAAAFLHRLGGRAVRFRADYGLYEYTAFVAKSVAPTSGATVAPTDYAVPPAAAGELDEAPAAPFAGTGSAQPRTRIPVCAPRLPPAEQLRPYLDRIDDARWYSNHGPLATLLQARLSGHFSVPAHAVQLAASGTAALVAAILGAAGRAEETRPVCLCPSYSFVATASAVQQCGYRPRFVDIARDSLTLDPDRLRDGESLDDVGLVVVVAPYGRPVDQVRWKAFQERTGIPVVLDAAASFDLLGARGSPGFLPTAVSLHATKVFSTGEGGLVLVDDAAVSERCARALNFGFSGSRDSIGPSINGKMSEYHAAVGLAELDGWPAKRASFIAVATTYKRVAAQLGVAEHVLCDTEHASSYVLASAADTAEAEAIKTALTRGRVDYRLWYGTGIHDQPFYRGSPHSGLDVTVAIAPLLIGLPMAVDLGEDEVRRILFLLRSALGPDPRATSARNPA